MLTINSLYAHPADTKKHQHSFRVMFFIHWMNVSTIFPLLFFVISAQLF